MFFSQTAEYALRAVAALAMTPQLMQTTQQLTTQTQAPVDYLSKVMRALVAGGIVHSQRGPNGGFCLAVSPKALTILDVINAVDPIRRIDKCPLNLPSHGRRLCPLHKRLDAAIAQVEKALTDTTLEDLLNEPTPSRPLCDALVPLTRTSK